MNELLQQVEASELAFQIGVSWLFPFIESLHVLMATLLLGAILMVDLRLLGLAALRYPSRDLMRDMLPWSWLAFVLAVVTGALLFIVRATGYLDNTAFQLKLLLLLLAGLNMLAFHIFVRRSTKGRLAQAQALTQMPKAAKLNGALSLLLWSGVMLAGRWIGHLI